MHDCKGWPVIAHAPYVWWIPADERWYMCNFCGQRTAVESSNAFMRAVGMVPPADDPQHPWWLVPQNETYSFYVRFWEQWPATKGRAFF